MKKFALFLAAVTATGLFAADEFEKSGFLTTEACAEAGAFKDCYMENYACGSDGCFRTTEAGVDKQTPLVLFSHDDGVIYKLDTSHLPRREFDEGVSRNEVSITGEFDPSTNTIVAHEFKAPPPPKKSFFKGCL
jgi:hypothetical protein